ncbi:MAG TPA: type II CAAX endopeptidase family protein [Streptosporangiaceae bacterium]|nr:type II CAAX endopeptidase family protein [Streptosporangiaceae bacterium]
MAHGQETITVAPPTRRLLGWEIVIVFALSLGGDALFAFISLIGSLTAPKSLGKQQALIVGSLAPGRPWLDLALHLAQILVSLAPVALVFYLLARENSSPSDAMGLDASQPGLDLTRGAALAAVVGGAGLGLYIAAFKLGASLNVVPENLPNVWWRIPVLILDAAQNGILEEVLVVGYLLRRLGQLGWSPGRSIATSAILRGSYHLYQGFGGFLGNAVLGVIFGVLYRRWGRVTPLIIAHTIIDAVAFVGYVELHGKVSWLP